MKNINQQRVLNVIYTEGPISRVEIADKTKLTQQTITNIVSRLLQERIVLEGSPTVSNGGRKPIPLMINCKELYAIGIDVTVKNIRGILMNFDNEIIASCEKSVTRFESGEHTLDCIQGVLDDLLAQVEEPEWIKGIGISVQGLVDHRKGSVLIASEMHWRDFHLKEKLEEKYSYPIYVENDVNMVAVFENMSGQLVSSTNNITIKMDQGIGGAIVIDKKLYAGSKHVAGEFGHYKAFYGDNAIQCHCGGKGCLTTVASIGGLEKNTGLCLQEISEHLQESDPHITDELNKIGMAIGNSIANIVTIFNPDHVLLTGKLIDQIGSFLFPLIVTIVRQSVNEYCQDFIIIRSHTGGDSAVMAGGLVIKETFKAIY